MLENKYIHYDSLTDCLDDCLKTIVKLKSIIKNREDAYVELHTKKRKLEEDLSDTTVSLKYLTAQYNSLKAKDNKHE